MITALDFLTQTVKTGASDIFIVAGRQLSRKRGGRIETASEERLMPADTEKLLREIYILADNRDISFWHRVTTISPLRFPDCPVSGSAPICSAAPWPQ